MDIHTNIAEFIMALLISSSVLIGLAGLILAQLRFASNLPTNSSIAKFLRSALFVSIVFGIIVFISCSVWFITKFDEVIYLILVVFLGQLYFFIRPAIRYGLSS